MTALDGCHCPECLYDDGPEGVLLSMERAAAAVEGGRRCVLPADPELAALVTAVLDGIEDAVQRARPLPTDERHVTAPLARAVQAVERWIYAPRRYELHHGERTGR